MTHNQKIQYMRLAAGMSGYGFTDEGLDLLVSIYDKVLAAKGKTSISDIVDIQVEVEKRADAAKKKQMVIEAKKK